MPVTIFFCYAHEDEALLNKLKTHLRPLQREGLIDVWHDRDIRAGTEWEREIREHLSTAQIILLLVSPDFIDSDYCYGIEMKRALEGHERGEARVIPVILRPVYWQGVLGKLQALPTDAKPVTDPYWHNLDIAFFNVAEGIRKTVDELLPKNSVGTLMPQPISRPFKRLRSQSVVVVLILLILILLGGSIVVYGAATGHLPWNASHPPIASGKTAQANVTATAASTVPIAAPTPTASPNSIQVIGNEPPIISDSLSSQDSLQWDVYPLDQNGACIFQGGAYHVIATPGNSNSCLATQTNFRDLALQVNLKIVRGDNGGIIFRSNAKEDSFYAFIITTNGSYSLIKSFLSNNVQTYAPLASGTSQEIKQGVNELNTLTVIIHGSTFSLYINTHYVGNATDTSYNTSGLVGVFTNADGGNTAEAAFTNFQVWRSKATA